MMSTAKPGANGAVVNESMLRLRWLAAALAAGVLLTACGSKPLNKAPVEDRSQSGRNTPPLVTQAPEAPAAPVKLLPGAENAGKPGYYTVKPGDTLIRIGLDQGQNWRDIARWSSLDNPNQIEVGQVLRVAPPTSSSAGGSGTATAATATTKPVATSAVNPAPLPSADKAASAPAAAAIPAPAPAGVEDEIAWIWPSSGAVLAGFDEVKNKGVDIGGAAGDPVLAAADGRVVYAGAGLRGYGNLVILKHNNTYLTAYAHNQTLLVKEDQTVRRGQKIAEMGNSDSERVKLHFEVRRLGKPVDPSKYLPGR